MNPLTGTTTGANNKAWAGAGTAFVGSEFVKPILDWLVNDGLSRALDACCGMPIPETAQTGIVWLGLAAFGYLAVWLIPANR